ncbi:hypothetical protein [Pontibaca salina]|uniref:Uncharacterized protein n=1 Tax=Pontibaca salina TaxID=2795731 RepID=A0A934HS39_9RHOB|nr:hypothetical protein [Pontibaca salina]MBI6629856.1 hypothetical protein [Pontibaca salina]
MPKLVKLYIRHTLIGFGIAALFVGMLMWFDVMNLRSLIARSDVAFLAVFMLWFMHGIVFAGVQFAWAVMSLAEKPKGPRRGMPVLSELKPIPVPVKEASGRARRRV